MIDKAVHQIGQEHHLAHDPGVLTVFVALGDGGGFGLQLLDQGLTLGGDGAQAVLKEFANEARTARGNVDVFPHEVSIDPSDKIVGVEVHILHAGVELGRHVVAKPLGVHANGEVFQRIDAGPTTFAHFFAAHGDKAMHENVVGRFAVAKVQHRGPKERVKVGDVFANEVVLLHVGAGHEVLKAARLTPRQGATVDKVIFECGQIAHRCIKPDIKVLARGIGDFNAEVGRIATDVPVAQTAQALLVGGEPLLDLVGHFTLKFAILGPFFEVVHALGVREFEKEML